MSKFKQEGWAHFREWIYETLRYAHSQAMFPGSAGQLSCVLYHISFAWNVNMGPCSLVILTISGAYLWLLCCHLDDTGLQVYQHVHQGLQFQQQLTRRAYTGQREEDT